MLLCRRLLIVCTCILLLGIPYFPFAQYSLLGNLGNLSDSIPPRAPLPFYKFKLHEEGKLIILKTSKSKNGVERLLTNYDLDSRSIGQRLQLDIDGSIEINDFMLLTSGKVLFTESDHTLYEYDTKTKVLKKMLEGSKTVSFSKIEKLTQQLFLLYQIYGYHPYSGVPEAQLYIYDSNLGKVVSQKHMAFEGISVANIVHQWIRVLHEKIYLVTPLTGKVFVFNKALKPVDTFRIAIPELQTPSNQVFISYMDDAKKAEDLQLEDIRIKNGEDFINNNQIISDYYTKEAILKRMDTLRNHFTYLEKIIPFNDTLMIATIFRPEYQMEFRDVYFFNSDNGRIVRAVKKWRCGASVENIISKPEDYFCVDLINSYLFEPFFYRDKIYTTTRYPADLFFEAPKKDIDKKLFQWQQKNGNIWSILEYRLYME